MRLEIFCLCDAATNTSGKMNILGAFDTIWASKLPSVHPACSVALRIRFDSIERGEHKIKLNFVNEDGKHIIPSLEGVIKVSFSENQQSGSQNLVLNIQGLKIEKCGEYSIDIAIDGKNEASLPLFVKKRDG